MEEQLDSTGSGADGAAGDGHVETARRYYDLCSDFMLMGWGEALHFAPLSREESLEDSKTRHQRLMIEQLELRAGMTVLDIGCGVGGPMRRVATEAGVRVTGVNNSRVQLDRARTLDAAVGLEGSDYVECSFMDMSTIADATFDRGYAIESTCHAPDKVTAFAEIHRVLKPGALFWCQEMCLTDAFDPNDARHQAIQQELRRGIALKRIATFGEVNQDLESAGFEVIEGTDLATAPAPPLKGPTTPWYQPMAASQTTMISTLLGSSGGRRPRLWTTRLLEAAHVLPRGSTDVAALLLRTAQAYVDGGETGIFTPLYCVQARKPD